MKRLFAMGGLLAALLLASCSNQCYTIDGIVEDTSLEGVTVYKIGRHDTNAAITEGAVLHRPRCIETP